jgi:hypothetical protein
MSAQIHPHPVQPTQAHPTQVHPTREQPNLTLVEQEQSPEQHHIVNPLIMINVALACLVVLLLLLIGG